MYCDRISPAMKAAMEETERRRKKQEEYNEANGITPRSVTKGIREVIEATKAVDEDLDAEGRSPLEMTKKELRDYVGKLEKEMKQAAADLQFERAPSCVT